MRAVLASSPCSLLAPAAAAAAPNVEIRRTAHGIPHIKAKHFDGAGLRLRLRVRPGQPVRDRRDLRDGQRRALALLRARRQLRDPRQRDDARTTSTRTSSSSGSTTTSVVEKLLEQPPPSGPLPEIREGARGYVAGYNALPARDRRRATSPTRAAAARRGSGRSPRSTPSGASTSSRCWPARAWRSTASAAPSRRRPPPAACRAILPPLPAAEAVCARSSTGSRSAASAPTRSRSARQATERRQRHAARQPALPVGRARALLPGAAHDPRQGSTSSGALAVRRAADPDRPHAQPGVEPHGLHRVPLHAVRAEARARLADDLPRRRPAARDARARRSRSRRASADGALEPRTRTLYSTELGPILTALLGLPLFPWTPATGLRAGRRQRGQLPLPQPLLRDQPGAEHRRSSTRSSAATRASRGSTRSPPTRRARPTTPTSARSRTSPTRRSRAATRRSGRATVRRARAAGARRLARGVRAGAATRTPRRPGILGAVADAVAVPRRLRDELQRLLLAVEPGAAARGLRRIIGDERTERSLRTRIGLRIVADQLAQGHVHAAARCRTRSSTTASSRASCCATTSSASAVAGPTSREACDVARRLGPARRPRLASGAVLFRRFVDAPARRRPRARASWRVPFDRRATRSTRRAGSTRTTRACEAGARGAVADLRGLGMRLDAPLREVQYERRGDERIPIHGGPGDRSASSTRSTSRGSPGEGYPNVPHGSSFVMAAHVRRRALPRRAHDPHLLAVDEPALAVLRRPDADVLAQGVGADCASASATSSPTAT